MTIIRTGMGISSNSPPVLFRVVQETPHNARKRGTRCNELYHWLPAGPARATGGHVVALESSGHSGRVGRTYVVQGQGSEVSHHAPVVPVCVKVLQANVYFS